MSKNIDNPFTLRYVPIAPVQFSIAAAAQGWVDQDCSLSDLYANKLYLVNVQSGAPTSDVGVRPHGSAVECHSNQTQGMSFLTTLSVARHVDLYRDDAVQNVYTFVGYFEVY